MPLPENRVLKWYNTCLLDILNSPPVNRPLGINWLRQNVDPTDVGVCIPYTSIKSNEADETNLCYLGQWVPTGQLD